MHVHIVSEFKDAMRGNELHALQLYRGLVKRSPVTLWSTTDIDPRLSAFPIRRINPYVRAFPYRGELILIGVFLVLGDWIDHAAPERVVVNCNTYSPRALQTFGDRLRAAGIDRPEFVFPSAWLMEASGLPGTVEPSFIDLDRFLPLPGGRPDRPFTIGRLSRDSPDKFHVPDDALYTRLAADGCHIRLMGATCLAPTIGAAHGIELLPENAEPAETFLQSLDCVYYRTADTWIEAFGRVVFESMACGIPVVAHWRGGYAEWIDDGTDGFLVEDPEEAWLVIGRLRTEPGLAARIGVAARRKAEAMFGAEAWERVLDFYVSREG